MKLFDIDWHDFIRRLAAWERLPLEARAIFAQLRASQGVRAAELYGQAEALAEGGFVEFFANRQRVRLAKPCHEFARVVRAMIRLDILSEPDDKMLTAYLQEHFSGNEIYSLGQSVAPGYRYGGSGPLAAHVSSVVWVEKFLAHQEQPAKKDRVPAADPSRWPSWLRLSKAEPASAPAPAPEPVSPLPTTKRLVRELMALPAPVPFRELPNRFADVPGPDLGAAIRLGIHRLVLFPAMRSEDMTPVLGLWPAITRRLHRVKANRPEPVEPQAAFHGALLMEDMTTVLVAAGTGALRLRGTDYGLFAKAEKDLVGSLMSVPEPVAKAVGCSPTSRIAVAMEWLKDMALATSPGTPGKDLRLQPGAKANDWLGGSAKERLKSILDYLRRSKTAGTERGLGGWNGPFDDDGFDDVNGDEFDEDLDDDLDDDDYDDGYGPCGRTHRLRTARYSRDSTPSSFLPFTLRTSSQRNLDDQLRLAVATAFGSLPGESFLPLDQFLDWQTQAENALAKLAAQEKNLTFYFDWSYRRPTAEELESLWRNCLKEFLFQRLVPLGGVRLDAADGRGRMSFALTDAGRYLLGLAADFNYGHEHDGQGQVIVQPNFEVVFLAPSPLAEAAVARLAERKRQGLGALFTITKKSIYAAAGAGLTASKVQETLDRISAKPVPANVAREISGWFEQCRRIRLHTAIVIHCPDADTAARVVAASGRRAVALTDTVVELQDTKAKTELLRKLQGMGVFLERPSASARHSGGALPGRKRG